MSELTAILGSIVSSVVSIIALLISLSSVRYQRRQTEIMEKQLDKAIELKITRDLAEGGIDNQLRTFLNHRLSDIRGQMRLEMSRLADQTRQQLDEFKQMLDEDNIRNYTNILERTVSTLNKHEGALDDFTDSTNKAIALASQVQALQQAVADIRRGVGNQEMIRVQIRNIAEQLLRMTKAHQGNESDYGTHDDTQHVTNATRVSDSAMDQKSPGAQVELDAVLPAESIHADLLAEDKSASDEAQQLHGQLPVNVDTSYNPPSSSAGEDSAWVSTPSYYDADADDANQ